eukprot:3988158-Alexandrium_andersonii.AAC.1
MGSVDHCHASLQAQLRARFFRTWKSGTTTMPTQLRPAHRGPFVVLRGFAADTFSTPPTRRRP